MIDKFKNQTILPLLCAWNSIRILFRMHCSVFSVCSDAISPIFSLHFHSHFKLPTKLSAPNRCITSGERVFGNAFEISNREEKEERYREKVKFKVVQYQTFSCLSFLHSSHSLSSSSSMFASFSVCL